MYILAQIVGLIAVVTFLLSYQQKKRKNIILFNTVSRCLYILQYLLLGAFSGAVLDVLGVIACVIAEKKHTKFVAKHTKLVFIAVNLCIIISGVAIAIAKKSWLDLFPIVGVLLHTSAFWMSDENNIRRVSLIGSPFWLVYNFLSQAYGSAIGDTLSICSIIIAMIRYKSSSNETKSI